MSHPIEMTKQQILHLHQVKLDPCFGLIFHQRKVGHHVMMADEGSETISMLVNHPLTIQI